MVQQLLLLSFLWIKHNIPYSKATRKHVQFILQLGTCQKKYVISHLHMPLFLLVTYLSLNSSAIWKQPALCRVIICSTIA